ncbi:MAG: IS91 family transposase [Planctomycetota bacterium]|jgi:Zn finger protein HypA/HybF involved in hydrogenase expression
MKEKRIELADVVRRFKDRYVDEFGSMMMPSQRKALADIAACMTAEMGGHQYHCRDCDQTFWVYHGCRNRACPACHGRQMRDWLEAREAELLPCDYYHVVATVPEELRHLFLSNQKLMYSLLMKTVAGAVIDLARDPRYLGATPGILMVLHTWTGQLQYHPHTHLLVTGGGVADDGQTWCQPPGEFLVPVKALSKLIAGRFRDALKKADSEAFGRLPRKTWKRAWCSFCKHYGRGRQAVVEYLARYAFRIAITNTRIVTMDDTHVTFKYKLRETGEWETCRLTGVEFLRRFLMHVLPKGFHKLRYYGLWHHSKGDLQERARLLLSLLAPVRLAECLLIADIAAEANSLSEDKDAPAKDFSPSCPRCGSQRVEHLQERRRGPAP